MTQPSDMSAKRFVLVTGPSGAGRTSALRVLEDAGYEAIDNLPLRLLPALIEETLSERPTAVGIDVRNRNFSPQAVLDMIQQLQCHPDLRVEVLYLECREGALLRRYSETRRRHPLAPEGQPAVGIAAEHVLLSPLRARADVLIDTTELNVHELRAEVEKWFSPDGGHHLAVTIQSFSYKRGLPHGADMVLDCRFLQNPYWEPKLRDLDGRDQAVADYVAQDPGFADFAQKTSDLSLSLLPAYRAEGKSHFSIAFGCTGGQHRSVAMAESHALRLAESGWRVSIRHRELDRQMTGKGGT